MSEQPHTAQQTDAPLTPEEEDLALQQAARREAARHGVGATVHVGVGEAAARALEADRVRSRGRGPGEDLGQDLVPEELRPGRALEPGREDGVRFVTQA